MSVVQAFEIPTTPSTSQKFTVSLSGTLYTLQLRWSEASQCWLLDLFDSTGVAILQGVPLVTGCNLLGQFSYLGIPDMLTVQTDHDSFVVPTYSSLGDTGHLYYLVVSQ